MMRPLMTKKLFLMQPSEPAAVDDAHFARDLVDTLEAHRATWAGMGITAVVQFPGGEK